MESKIGKLGKIGDVSESAEYKFLTRVINDIIEKQGEIIDHLNSQDQEEEKIVRSKEDMERTDYTDYPQETTTEDTPEERRGKLTDKEIEEVRKYIHSIDFPTPMRKMPNLSAEDRSRVLTIMRTIMFDRALDLISQLLEEREREVLKSVLKEADKRGHYYDEDTEYEVIKEMLDKLKDKK